MSPQKHRHTTHAGLSFDPSVYPRTYSISAQYQRYWIVVGFAFALGFPLLLWQSPGMNTLPKVFVALPAVFLGWYLILEAYKLRVILDRDAITVEHTFSSRRLLRCEIAGWKTGDGGRGTTTRVLIPQDDRKKALKCPEILRTDPAFFTWFVGIPNLNSR